MDASTESHDQEYFRMRMSGSSFNITIITSIFAIKEFTESLGIRCGDQTEDKWTVSSDSILEVGQQILSRRVGALHAAVGV
jgi:hypothetical protein